MLKFANKIREHLTRLLRAISLIKPKIDGEKTKKLFRRLCSEAWAAQYEVEQEQRGNDDTNSEHTISLFINKKDKVTIEMRKEEAPHNLPHIHVKHSDKFDAVLSIPEFNKLDGNIGGKALKNIRTRFASYSDELIALWEALNVNDAPIVVEELLDIFKAIK